MTKPVLARQNFAERAERHKLLNRALVDLADLGVFGHGLNARDRGRGGFLVHRGDKNAAVVFDIDLGARLFDDLADVLAAGANEHPDLFGIDSERRNARRVLRKLLGRLDAIRDHVEDFETRLSGLIKSFFELGFGDAVDLHIHLKRGQSLAGPGGFEIHIAQMVFDPGDVRQDLPAVSVRDKSDRDTGDRRLDRHPGAHQRERSAANRGHGT